MNSLRLDTVDSNLDYIIDDIPLWDWVAFVTGEDAFHGRRATTPFGSESPLTLKGQRFCYEMLVGKRPGNVGGGHVPLYVCECCADYACGVTSAIVTKKSTTVHWNEFALFYPDGVIENMPELVFDKVEYLNALSVVG